MSNRPEVTEEVLLKLLDEGKSTREIGVILNRGQSTIMYWSRKFGISRTFHGRWSDAEFTIAVKNNTSINSIIIALGYSSTGGMRHSVNREISRLNLDTTHVLGRSQVSPKKGVYKSTLEEILVEDRPTNTYSLKKRLFDKGVLVNICSKCNMGPSWQGDELVLHLDHVNGDNNDNRLKNLRVLCPNCHSQTETYAGRNIKLKKLNNGV